MLNFPVNRRLFYALATADLDPLIKALEDTRERRRNAQWVQFLRSHDEVDLGRLTDESDAMNARASSSCTLTSAPTRFATASTDLT